MKDTVEIDEGGKRGGYEEEDDITDEKDFKKNFIWSTILDWKCKKDILTTGEVYKPKIKKKMEDF